MSKHFLALIGTSLYEPIVYYEDGFISSEQEFIQLALVEKYKEDFRKDPDSRITFFMTEKAKKLNVDDRTYTETEIDKAGKWASARRNEVTASAIKRGMKEQFDAQFPEFTDRVKWVSIADAQTEDQISSVFTAIYDELRVDDEIIFDITHSFRSIPMLAMTVINYAKVLKNCTLKQICYGAYEAADKPEQGQPKKAPINDLTLYDDILSWTNAADSFMRFGNASLMKECFYRKFNGLQNSEKSGWKDLRKAIDSAEKLSNAIQTCRGVDVRLLEGYKKGGDLVSIKAAYESFGMKVTEESRTQAKDIAPLVPLMERVNDRFSLMNKGENYEIGMSVVEWSIQNGMVQQGYTALEESIKTYLCWKYGLNEVDEYNRDDIAGTCMWLLNNQNQIEIQKLIDEIAEKNPEKREAVAQMMTPDNLELAQLLSQVKDDRNDINHFGMRKSPGASDKLKEKLEKYYIRFKEIVNR